MFGGFHFPSRQQGEVGLPGFVDHIDGDDTFKTEESTEIEEPGIIVRLFPSTYLSLPPYCPEKRRRLLDVETRKLLL